MGWPDAYVDVASDYLFFLSEVLGVKKSAYYLDDSKQAVVVRLDESEIDALTDWIMNFNFSTRKPAGLPMPDLYLGEEKIRNTTVIAYCSHISDFILTMVENQKKSRDNVAQWAWSNFESTYKEAHRDALQMAQETN
ncbi:hypothetical protein [Limnohabitans sp. T6-20]|uniref:hypothetical protein n=1 Tax=Limnohabitans sp. T6-20 TaxID=1100725 RepID=UPI0011B1EC8B|nr:hypothetical protein [Limnohabitans sp. T6-20]